MNMEFMNLGGIGSREKIGTIAKKIVAYLYMNRKEVFNIKTMINSFGGDARKLLEIIFLIEGIGILTRISRSKFIFSGLKGFIIKFNQYIETRIAEKLEKEKLLSQQPPYSQTQEQFDDPASSQYPQGQQESPNTNSNPALNNPMNYNPYSSSNLTNNSNGNGVFDEILLGDKLVNLAPYLLLSVFVSELIFTLLLDVNKCIGKHVVDTLFEKKIGNHKDASGFKNWMDVDVSKILIALNLIETSENSQVIHWYGPDFINLPGVNMEILHTIKNLPEVLHDSYKEYTENFPTEFQEREDAFFMTLIYEYKGLKGWSESKGILSGNVLDDNDTSKKFREYGFAM